MLGTDVPSHHAEREMTARVRDFDWAATPLGPRPDWPRSLQTLTEMLLTHPFAMIVLWGPQLVQIYNDGYRLLMGSKHPGGLGQPTRECWPEVWHFNAPIYQGVVERGETFEFQDQPLTIHRHGHDEQAFFTLSFSPVQNDDGSVGGVLVTVIETTERVRAEQEAQEGRAVVERRNQALEAFAELARDFALDTDPDRLILRAQEVVTPLLPAGFSRYFEPEDGLWRVRSQVGKVPTPELQAVLDTGLSFEHTPNLLIPWRSGEAHYQEADDPGMDGLTGSGAYPQTTATLPVRVGNRIQGVLGFALFEARSWSRADRAVLDTVQRGLSLALERADHVRRVEEDARAQEAFVAFSEAVGTETDVLALARQAMGVLQARFPNSSAAYYEPEDALWKARAYSDDIREDLVALLTAGVPETPHIREVLRTRSAVFVNAWDATREEVENSEDYGSAGNVPLIVNGEVRGILAVGLRNTRQWTEHDQAIVRAVGRGLTLALERQDRQRTVEKRAQADVFASQSRLRLALDAAGLGDWELDLRDGHATRSLQHDAIFGYPQGHPNWTYDAFLAHVLPEDRDEVDRKYRVALSRGEAWDFQCRVRRADGEVRWVWARGAALPSVEGKPTHMLGLVQDITEDKRVEEELHDLNTRLEARVRERTHELQAANEELEAFAYSVSHDLRTPVRHITGFNELLRKTLGNKLDDQAARYLQVVNDAAARMNALIDAMLDLSRTSRTALRPGLVDLGALVAAVRTDLEPDTQGRCVAWSVAPLPLVTGDADLLRQVMANLLGNAVKYTRKKENALIEVWAEERSGEWAFFVRDNGVGFDPRYADRLFGVFQRLHRADEFEGTGVGLANVRRIVARHGGRVWVQGALGEGATFGFSLPK